MLIKIADVMEAIGERYDGYGENGLHAIVLAGFNVTLAAVDGKVVEHFTVEQMEKFLNARATVILQKKKNIEEQLAKFGTISEQLIEKKSKPDRVKDEVKELKTDME